MAKPQAKAAPAPVDEAATEIELGSFVTFLGYPEGTPEAEMILVAGEQYEVIQLPGTEDIDGVPTETGYVLQIPNPDFNKKKKVHPETNPEFLETEVFEEEIELAGGDDQPDDQANAENDDASNEEGNDDPLTYAELLTYDLGELIEFAKVNEVKLTAAQKKTPAAAVAALAAAFELTPEEPEPETPAPTKGKGAAATKGKAADAAPAKGAAATKGKAAETKGKATETKAPAKAPAKAPTPANEEIDPDEVPELDNEDADVLALVENADDLIAVAQDLESAVAVSEYQLGGVLYHIKKEKLHLAKNKKGQYINPEYAEAGGFKLFLMNNFNLDYRKATYLIDIYINFTQAGIENPAEVVGRIGWTKASKIAKPLGQEGADVDGLIEAAETNTVQDLSEVIKDQFTVGKGEGASAGSAGTKVTRLTLRFRYVEDEANVVEDILKVASDRLGVKPEEALFQILTDWHAQDSAAEEEAAAAEEAAKGGKGATKAPARGAARARA